MSLPRIVAHADWSTHSHKRWLAVATLEDGVYRVDPPTQIVNSRGLLTDLRTRAASAKAVVGFDFPIGLPIAYAERAGINNFPDALIEFGVGRWKSFYDLAEASDEISLERPFYPYRPGDTAQKRLVAGLGLTRRDDLYRQCELPTLTRGAACPLFWTLGAKQVGRAAISGWTEVLTPTRPDPEIGIWPFDGQLSSLLANKSCVVVETYPAEAGLHLGLTAPGRSWSKRSQPDRRQQNQTLFEWCRENFIESSPYLIRQLQDGFGDDPLGEDRFDAYVGLLGMLNTLMFANPYLAPETQAVTRVEGWIFGQAVADPLPQREKLP